MAGYTRYQGFFDKKNYKLLKKSISVPSDVRDAIEKKVVRSTEHGGLREDRWSTGIDFVGANDYFYCNLKKSHNSGKISKVKLNDNNEIGGNGGKKVSAGSVAKEKDLRIGFLYAHGRYADESELKDFLTVILGSKKKIWQDKIEKQIEKDKNDINIQEKIDELDKLFGDIELNVNTLRFYDYNIETKGSRGRLIGEILEHLQNKNAKYPKIISYCHPL
ncbi:MAG: hypothetical protein RsTaC01_0879 [Candidatus Paraimprobicoccus trichonymphae]|uniref:Uncharacterized protein n=1 Tax=Candidatus Paraimprobicoccus trichonymphae TaxID=3033793 RepID=A0AA48KWF4_9FIRM|nr:MAG: hypothetical protein RsTaC01_0879 [Candidatus Paraimprobicoccus trichonymphae]